MTGCGRHAAENFQVCCQTCAATGGKQHGPRCNAAFKNEPVDPRVLIGIAEKMTKEQMVDWRNLQTKDRYSDTALIWDVLEVDLVVLIRGKWILEIAEMKSLSVEVPTTGGFPKLCLRLKG